MNLYYLLAYFLIYAFLGWVVEVAFHVVSVGKIINRGFLNGPVCPIYGVGMIGILTLLSPLSPYPILLYAGGILFATFVELVGGFVLFKLFHMRWWDYSKEPFNLGGYICLKFSIAWGICIIFVLKIIHPVIELNVYILDNLLGHIAVIALCGLFIMDMVLTVLSIMNLNKDLKRLNALAADIRRSSDSLTEKIGHATFDMEVRVQEGRVQAALAKAEGRDKLEELRDRADDFTDQLRDRADDFTDQIRDRADGFTDQLRDRREGLTDQLRERAEKFGERMLKHPVAQRFFGYERFRRAFPNMYHEEYDRELQVLNETLRSGKKGTIAKLLSRREENKEQ